MKNLIYLLVLILITLSTGSWAQAQQHERPQGPPPIPSEKQLEKMVGDLSDELNLSDKQQSELSKIVSTHFDVLKGKAKAEKENREVHRKEMEDLRKEFEKEVSTILTEEQQKQFAEIRKNHQPPKGEHSQKLDKK